MTQLLQAPTEGYEDAIAIPEINANFELKHGLINLVQNKQFFGHDKEDPHAHIRYFNKITSTMRFPNILSTLIKLMLFLFSLEGSARIWLEKEPPRSILTWDDLVSKFINQFFPPSKTTNLRNEITRFQQRFDESFYEAWDRFNDLLRACPHHGFSELHQLDTFYNALNANDQDSLNSAAGGNFLDKMPRECLRIIESKSKVRNSRNKAVVAKVSSNSSTLGISPDVAALTTEVSELKNMMKTMLIDKQKAQAPAPVKAVEQSCVTCGGAHSYRNCPATDGNVYRDNIQEYVSQAAAANFNQGNTNSRPPMVANQIRPPGFPPIQNNQNRFNQNQGNNFNQNRGTNFNQNRGNNFYQGQVYQPPTSQPPVYQAQPYQAPAQQMQGVSKTDFENYVKANDAVLRNMQNQGQGLQNQMTNLTEMLSKFVNSNTASSSNSGSLPSNTVTNPKEDLKGITTRSGASYQGPTIPTSSPRVAERRTEVTKDTIFPTNNRITEDVQPPVVPVENQNPVSEPVNAPVSAPMPNPKPSIPYPSRQNDEKHRENANEQKEKFYEIFKDMSFEISFMDALTLMPKFASTLKALIGNKEKLSEMARTPLNEHCSAVILNKLPEKLGDPGRFLIPCKFPGMDECLALADLGASINLMPFSVWKKLNLPNLTPTCITTRLYVTVSIFPPNRLFILWVLYMAKERQANYVLTHVISASKIKNEDIRSNSNGESFHNKLPAEDKLKNDKEGHFRQRVQKACTRVFTDLSAEEKEMYKADIRAMNNFLQIPTWNNQGRPFQRNNARGVVGTGNVGGQNRVGNMNPGAKNWMKSSLLFLAWMNKPPILMTLWNGFWALIVDHVFEADQCINLTMKPANHILEFTPLWYKIIDTFVDHYGWSIHSRVHEMQNDVQQHYVVDADADNSGMTTWFIKVVMSNHARPVVHDSEDTRDMAEITRKRMMEKMQSPSNVCCKINEKRLRPHIPKPLQALTVMSRLRAENKKKIKSSNISKIEGSKGSIRVSSSTRASESKPRSNTKKNRILPAKTENKKQYKCTTLGPKSQVLESNGRKLSANVGLSIEIHRKKVTNLGKFCDSDLEVASLKAFFCFVTWILNGARLTLKVIWAYFIKSRNPRITPQQNWAVSKDRNRTLVEAHGTMPDISPKAPKFLSIGKNEPVPTATVVNAPIVSTNTSVSTTIAQDAPSTSHSLSSLQGHPPVFPQGVAARPTIEDNHHYSSSLHSLSSNPLQEKPSSYSQHQGLPQPNLVDGYRSQSGLQSEAIDEYGDVLKNKSSVIVAKGISSGRKVLILKNRFAPVARISPSEYSFHNAATKNMRPDLVNSVCMCPRYHAKPTKSTPIQMRIIRDFRILKKYVGNAQFLGDIDWFRTGSSKNKEARPS
ncbi:reverse transcriptase domain-containing protein [Tanacetum coccineum]|uniref:Reverse transcriptase domain-containing protein n=1 Tax=Tanacetum coccineum TaxID=301880 RepID=A0ABQ5DFW3_9ASTR